MRRVIAKSDRALESRIILPLMLATFVVANRIGDPRSHQFLQGMMAGLTIAAWLIYLLDRWVRHGHS